MIYGTRLLSRGAKPVDDITEPVRELAGHAIAAHDIASTWYPRGSRGRPAANQSA